MFGWLGDKVPWNRNYIAGLAGVYCGALTCVSLMFTSFQSLLIYSILFGSGVGKYFFPDGAWSKGRSHLDGCLLFLGWTYK